MGANRFIRHMTPTREIAKKTAKGSIFFTFFQRISMWSGVVVLHPDLTSVGVVRWVNTDTPKLPNVLLSQGQDWFIVANILARKMVRGDIKKVWPVHCSPLSSWLIVISPTLALCIDDIFITSWMKITSMAFLGLKYAHRIMVHHSIQHIRYMYQNHHRG